MGVSRFVLNIINSPNCNKILDMTYVSLGDHGNLVREFGGDVITPTNRNWVILKLIIMFLNK